MATFATTPPSPPLTKGAILALICVIGAWYVGNFHFVYGAGISMQKVEKLSWSLSETLINYDEVAGLPMFMARAKYPLFVQAMENLKR